MSTYNYQDSLAQSSLAGYTYQLMWGLLALIQAKDNSSTVSIECIDDVAVEAESNTTVIQAKFQFSEGDSTITDLSENLWKTLRNWTSYAHEHDSKCEKTEFCLVTNTSISPTSILARLKKGITADELQSLFNYILDLKTKSSSIKEKIDYCTSEEFKSTFKAVLSKSFVGQKTQSVLTEMKDSLPLGTGIDADKCLSQIMGWYTKIITTMIDAGLPINITKTSYNGAFIAAVINVQNPNVIGTEQATLMPSQDYYAANSDAVYIKQIGLIGLKSRSYVETAIEDFYKFSEVKNTAISNGEILPDHWQVEAERLVDHWDQAQQLIPLENSDKKAEEIGLKIYKQSMNPINLPKLAGYEREPYVVRGHYHALADEEKVWWHPEYHEVKNK